MSAATRNLGVAPAAVPYDWPHRETSRMVTAGACDWHVQRMGQGEPMLLLHGTAASTHTWRDMMPHLARSHDVIACDLPGHGFSSRLPGGATGLADLTAAVGALLEALDARPRAIVGHSAGAAIALNLAIRRLATPTHLVGINAALLPFGGALKGVFSPLAQFFASTRLMPKMLSRRARDPKAIERILGSTGSTLKAEGRDYYQRLLQRETHLAAVLAMMASWELRPLLDELPGLEARLLLVVGDNDRAVSPKEADSVADVVSDASVRQLPGLGHLAHEEAPLDVAAIIDDFVGGGG